MKLTLMLLTASLFAVAGNGLSQSISVNAKNSTVEEVIALVEEQAKLVFIYKKEILKDAPRINLAASNMPVEQFLEKAFKDQPFTWSIRNQTVVLKKREAPSKAIDFIELLLTGNNVPVTGRVAHEGKPVEGASVQLQPSGIGTTTNANGVFMLNNVPPGNYTLQITSIGYSTFERKINVKNAPVNMTCNLELLVKVEEEVVISTGYTVKKPGELTGSTQKISGDMLRKGLTSADPASLLKGRAVGLYISEQNAADPNSSGGQIFVRGQSSIAGVGVDQFNEFVMPSLVYGPLIVLDGVIMPNQNLKDLVTPQEIQDITVLKDAAATSIYGSRAAAGVLVVTTKRGRSEKPRITAELKYGINKPNQGRLRFLSGPELYAMQKDFFTQDYEINKASLSPLYPTLGAYLNYRLPAEQDVANSFDWSKYAFVTTNTKEANISASGGNDRTKYYLGATYYDEQSTGVATGLIRKSFRLNLQSKLTERLTASISLNGIFNNGKRDQGDVAGYQIYLVMPWANPYNAEGAASQSLKFKLAGAQREMDNPIFNRQYNSNTLESQLLFGSAKLEYRLTDWLSISTTNSANLNYTKNVQYIDVRTYGGGTIFYAPQGFLGTNTGSLQSYLTSNQLNVNKRFGEHSLRVLTAMEFGKTTTDNILVNVNQVRAGYPVISLGRQVGGASDLSIFGIPTTKNGNIEGGKDVKAVYSVFGEAGYTYKDRYSLSASARTDASSSFGRNNRYGTFYSVGGAWVLGNEEFLKNAKWLTFLKLRTNYGTSGSQLGDNFLTRTLYDPTGIYSGQGAANISTLGNSNLRWEITKTFSAGLDMELFKRITATVDYYSRRSEDLLQKVMLPPLAGFPLQWQNAGTVQNSGIELQINSELLSKKEFGWSMSFNFAYNRNRIVSVANDSLKQGYYAQYSYYMFKGDDINSLKAIRYAGVDPENGKPLFEKLIFDEKGNKTGVEYVNTVAEVNGAADHRQFQTIGSFQPKYFGGFTNTFTHKQFSLSVLITYALKYVIRDNLAESMQGRRITGINQLAFRSHQKLWTTPGQTDATEPSLYYNSTSDYFGTSKYIHDASNASLRNVRLSYDLPQSLLKRLKSTACTFYFSADNLYTLYSREVIASSPEGPSVGEAQDFGNGGGTLAIPRRYVFGLQVTF
ncbi:SusC/RagA family TonB-linked outer membrane protein [Pseudobacter ginsenosidimutans]|jgi:TonB-linked SusC/RagA family outer membrane protein|nr:SusC/RagA family TonB-linked outer membrane protein [Pseudobacter ginsenosidimutans]